MQKIIVEIADVTLSAAVTVLTHLQANFPNNADVQKACTEALPVLQTLQTVIAAL